ncbi:BUD7 [Candida pseudojiufengensis]|uniref:BUD7 n=1 Tax=Candida pseudojiufengensis TaxID=497109 RepID=UPI002225530A|nr:BUD7 [Candida pseudojiufengensis]KAI5964096.1 BUD7 [Candida pseudojiufengensis]
MLPPSLGSIPEVKEDYPGASLIERTARLQQFIELGPPDLCNIYKHSINSKRENGEIGTFLYFTGVDTSSIASIAAHLQSLANLMTSKSQYWFGEKKHWKVPQLTYCTFNSFSKTDMRVTVHIPGKFEIQIINQDGKTIQDKLTEEQLDKLWTETFITSIVRAVLESEDGDDVNKVGGVVEIRKINPFNNGIVSKELLNNFLIGFEDLFFQGSKLGCNVDIPQPTIVNNYLVDGFLKVIQLTQSYDRGLEILNRLYKIDPSIISIIAQLQLLKQDEIEAVKTMCKGIQDNKRDSNLLILQAEYCLDKKKPELALELAKQAVKSSPSDYSTWSILVKCYTKLGDFENALLTLNSCPMNSHKEKYQLKRVVPVRSHDDLHLPSPMDVTLDEVSNLQSNDISFEHRNLDPQLSNLPAANLKTTYAKAYDLLTEIVAKTGWEQLLKYRAKVFVMEEEYRKDKKTANGHLRKNSTQSSITVNNSSVGESDVDSTTAVKSPTQRNLESAPATADSISPTDGEIDYDDEFRKKRLCERWLDNLFMLLYEDLRAFTMWQAESVHFQAQQMEYKKTTLEWEILGSIAYRLKHFKEGSVAFANALSGRFSAKSQREMLKYYLKEKNKLLTKNTTTSSNSANFIQNYSKLMNQLNEKILESIVKLLVWNHRWYSDFSPFLLLSLSDLVAWEGSVKIESSITALYNEAKLPGSGSKDSTRDSSKDSSKDDHFVNHGIISMMKDFDSDYIRLYNLSNADE